MVAPIDDPGAAWRSLYEAVLAEHESRMRGIAASGTTPGELKALFRLEPGQGATAAELSRAWNNDPSTTTWLVDRLERRGLVERRIDAHDRRVKRIVLTEVGVELRARLTAELHRPPAAFLALTAADLRAANALARKLDRPAGDSTGT